MKRPHGHNNDQSSTKTETYIERETQKGDDQEFLEHAGGVELVVNNAGTIDALIEKEVIKLAAQCRLFKDESQAEDQLAVFQRNEVLTGEFLGNGAFSEVHQVWGFHLANCGSRDPKQERARLELCSTTYDQNGESAYVLKHLRRDLHHRGANKFINAAGDLVMEAKFLAYFDHQNIIKLHAWSGPTTTYHGNTHDAFFLILDRLDLTLSHKLIQWQMNPLASQAVYSPNLCDYSEKLNIAKQIASGLEYLHSRDIIFRDLKPGMSAIICFDSSCFECSDLTLFLWPADNIGFRGSTVQLFDFGLCRELPEAKPVEEKTFHMSGVGTKRYMAPEVFVGNHYNLKADVYSWSIVFHTMLSLQKPFDMFDAIHYKELVCDQGARPPIFEEWPQGIQDLCRNGWAQDPRDRFTIGEVREELERLQALIPLKDQYGYIVEMGADDQIPFVIERSSSFDQSSVEDLMDNICSPHHICLRIQGVQPPKGGKSFLRMIEGQMIRASAPYERHITSYPNLKHLRSHYL